mmetsp:Transcript_37331/g.82111  ORF Transcript_37331/g.82111 Transcript_37331/m.82111 type:complete len:241 (+) Transcript_37331:548-1270(+)
MRATFSVRRSAKSAERMNSRKASSVTLEVIWTPRSAKIVRMSETVAWWPSPAMRISMSATGISPFEEVSIRWKRRTKCLRIGSGSATRWPFVSRKAKSTKRGRPGETLRPSVCVPSSSSEPLFACARAPRASSAVASASSSRCFSASSRTRARSTWINALDMRRLHLREAACAAAAAMAASAAEMCSKPFSICGFERICICLNTASRSWHCTCGSLQCISSRCSRENLSMTADSLTATAE